MDAECSYAKSLRGYNRTRKTRTDRTQSMHTAILEHIVRPQSLPDPVSAIERQSSFGESELADGTDTISIPRVDDHDKESDYLIDVYYQNVHPAHPFVIPRKLYLQDRSLIPDFLKRTMHFIAIHTTDQESDAYRDRAQLILEPTSLRNGFRVQALVLFALASYACFDRDQGNLALTQAVNIALQIKMDTNDFEPGLDPMLRESFRRTWWELYSLTSLISLITGVSYKLPLSLEMTLPGHCEDYNAGRCSQVLNLEYLHDQCFREQETNFSSLAYKIEATRLLGKAMDLCESSSPKPLRVSALSASISAFKLSIPRSKRNCLNADREIDEVMFCALIIINVASIRLQFPQSSIKPVIGPSTVCGSDKYKSAAGDCELSTLAACQAANVISGLIMARNSFSTLSPCMSCLIAASTSVHLAAYMSAKPGEEAEDIAEHIKLTLSALKVIGQRWPIGRVVRGQMAQYAREVFKGPARAHQLVEEETMAKQPPNMSLPLENEPWMQEFLNEDYDVTMERSLFDPVGLNGS